MRTGCSLALFGALAQFLILSIAEAAGPGTAGSLEGRVLFEGGKASRGLRFEDVVLYLKGDSLGGQSALRSGAQAPAVLDQRDIQFVPHVLPVLAGTKVEFRNGDTILHNVHTTSSVNPAFNRAQLGKSSMQVTFETPEIIHAGCDVHSQMSAYILVLPNPFFTKARKDGSFVISNIPPGKYELTGWHEKYQTSKATIEIIPGGVAQLDLDFTKASEAPGGGQP